MCTLLMKKDIQAVIWIKRHLFEQKHCNLGDTDSGSEANCTLKRTLKGRVCKGKIHKV